MPWLTQLADVARRTGYPVTETPGWRSRGHGPQPAVRGIVCHHTAGRADMHVVRDGRPGLDGPLSQIWLRRDGTIFIVASGRCWHNAPSTSADHTNSNSIGIEAENNGSEPWPARQLDAYRRLCAELCKEFGLDASAVKGHKEVNTSKPDPHSISMTAFRAEVAALLRGDSGPMAEPISWTETLVKDLPDIRPGMTHTHVKTVRALLHARGYAPKDLFSHTYGEDDEDLRGRIDAFKKAKGHAQDGVFGEGCWKAALA
jgi:hypothetical protein